MKFENEKDFIDAIENAASMNADKGAIEKQVKILKDALKEYMKENDIESAQGKNFSATFYVTEKSTMNEDKLKEIIEQLIEDAESEEDCERLSNLIEYKPTINTSLLEDMIYHGEIDQEVVLPAVVVTTSEGIRFGKAKKYPLS